MKKLLLTSGLIGLSVFSLEAQTHDYAFAQHLSTYFLGGQRCGTTQSWLHGACHTTDGNAVSKDLTGGWHDCGDYIKFHHTAPYAALMYLYGFDNFPEAYADDYTQANSAPPANGIPDILDEVKIETDYLIKCVDGSTIYYQVGGMASHGEDHDSFSEPVSASEEKLYSGSKIRPCRSTTSGHSNALGDAAAALALMSILYEPYDAVYALSCKNAAIQYYTVAKISPGSTADYDNLAYSFLSGTKYKDELAFAAAVLYRATNTSSYLTEAINYASGSNMDNSGTFDYSNVAQLANLELYRIHKVSNPSTAATYLNKVKSKVNGYTTASCGYIHLTGWGSLREAGCAAFLASLYHLYSSDAAAYTFAKKNVDYILGTHAANGNIPANFSFLIGYDKMNGGYPRYPHHAAAFGYKSNENPWGKYTQSESNPTSVPFKYELKGGLAGGPESSCSNFNDNIGNYVSSEYCTYYNSGFTGAVAYINKVENNISTGVGKIKMQHILNVFPNPANDQLVITSNLQDQFTILDCMGRMVDNFSLSGTTVLNISTYAPGLYFIVSSDASVLQKFVKE
ncbi:MAG: glycoside hydrolase family 9 protein [Bacteroidetes bacterium]|nr:glycoside hydrolase family 9 protein [Bacteroidota bacterium]